MKDYWESVRTQTTDFGDLVRHYRTRIGVTQWQLCVTLGIVPDPSIISRVESGLFVPAPIIGERLTAWIDEQARLQTPESVADGADVLSHQTVTPTPPRGTHPDTSRRAMDSVNRETAWAVHQWIIEQLEQHPEGATHENLWMLYTRLQPEARSSQSGLRTRVSELVRGGVVVDSGRTRTMSTGRSAIVWTLNQEGNTA